MNAADVIGWIVDSTYYCPDCTPSTGKDATPVFGDSEADSFSHCEVCEGLIPEVLTSDGIEYVLAKFRWFLARRQGRPAILRMWADQLLGYGLPSDEKEIVELVVDATEEDNLKAAKVNVCGKVREILLAAEPCEECSNPECGAIRAAVKEIES